MKYKIKNILGSGSTATTFLIKSNNKCYALRRQKIYKNEVLEYKDNFKNEKIIENTDKSFYRLIYFNKFINTINKNHFTVIYEYNIDKCKFTQPLTDWVQNNPDALKHYNALINSKYCFDIITDIKDGIINDILYRLNNEQVYSCIIQIVFAFHLMHSNGFYHRDCNANNFMYKKTSLKTIKILGMNIPTFGYLFSLIDYMDVISTKFKLSDSEMSDITIRNYKYEDMVRFLYSCIFHDDYIYKNIINKLLNDKKLEYKYPEIEAFKYKRLTYEDTKYYCLNINDPKKIIKYFYKLIKLKK
jgi:serine/threonine protein kinase